MCGVIHQFLDKRTICWSLVFPCNFYTSSQHWPFTVSIFKLIIAMFTVLIPWYNAPLTVTQTSKIRSPFVQQYATTLQRPIYTQRIPSITNYRDTLTHECVVMLLQIAMVFIKLELIENYDISLSDIKH